MTVSRKLEMMSSKPPILSNVTSMDEGGMISPAIVCSYSSSSRAASSASERPVCDSSVSPFCRDLRVDLDGPSMEERTYRRA